MRTSLRLLPIVLALALLALTVLPRTASAQDASRTAVAEAYCNDALIALAYIEATPRGLQVSAYPPVALCAGRFINVPLLVQYLLLHGERVERDGAIVYKQVVPVEGELVKVELVVRSVPRGAPLLPVFEVVAVVVLLGAAYSWANRHSVEVL